MTTRTYPTRADWLAARRLGLGASDSAALFGESPWQSPLALYAEKRGLSGSDERDAPEYVKWGLKLEPAIAQAFEEDTGRRVIDVPAFTIERDASLPFLCATLDRRQARFADESLLAPQIGVLELKTTNRFMRRDWDDGVPLHYQIQVQHQLAVTGEAFASVAVLIAGAEFLWVDVPRHEAFIDELRRRCAEFWARVEAGDPPPVDASQATRDALHRMYPSEAVPEMISLSPDLAQWDEARVAGKAAVKTANEQILLAEAHIKAAIGEHAGGIIPGGAAYTWRLQQKKAYAVAASASRVLRRKGD